MHQGVSFLGNMLHFPLDGLFFCPGFSEGNISKKPCANYVFVNQIHQRFHKSETDIYLTNCNVIYPPL